MERNGKTNVQLIQTFVKRAMYVGQICAKFSSVLKSTRDDGTSSKHRVQAATVIALLKLTQCLPFLWTLLFLLELTEAVS